ncbi:hypothetical protein [Pseudomonas moorei]|uniref:hypothetical protein n=1 Tax=Pseudomonas moorei TaxID=395599 RepID=UPI00200ED781|nr:hypothetical protein [Pseudomonas moorei]
MVALRYDVKSTSVNVRALCDMIRDGNSDQIILFASERNKPDDEDDNNLPLVAALVQYTIPHIGHVYVVFDGVFLTAARYPRYLEVRDLLELAETSGKVFFCQQPVPLTSSLPPEQAVETMKASGSIKLLDVSSRASYFSLLSHFSEQAYVDMHRVS